MAYALELAFDIPPAWGYLRLRAGRDAAGDARRDGHQPAAGVDAAAVARDAGAALRLRVPRAPARARRACGHYAGEDGRGGALRPAEVRRAMTVGIALMTQMGEQADYLRFMPARTAANRRRWWAGRGHRRPGLGAAGRAEDAGRRAAGVDRDRPVGAAGSRGRPEPDVPRGLGHRVQPARHGGGRDGGVRRAVAAQDQRHQRLRRLARLVELLRAADAQPPGPRRVGRVQHGRSR